MADKYLPIGTVCTVKGNTNKIMIVGFLSLDYNGNLNVYDYKGCIYPKGLFSSSGTISFNHADIDNVEFMGYKTDFHENLSTNLHNASVIDAVEKQTKSNKKSQYVFDKNGVIIMDNTYEESNKKTEEKPIEIFNPFAMEYESQKEDNSIKSKFKFDKNGVIIEDNSIVDKKSDKPMYEFDENGFIVSDNTVSNTATANTNMVKENNSPISKFTFDENGVIISEN